MLFGLKKGGQQNEDLIYLPSFGLEGADKFSRSGLTGILHLSSLLHS